MFFVLSPKIKKTKAGIQTMKVMYYCGRSQNFFGIILNQIRSGNLLIRLKNGISKMKYNAMLALILISLLLACGKENNEASSGNDLSIPFKLKTRWKHDTEAWTQGLLIHQGRL